MLLLFCFLTCIVKTPSSWEESFFICSAKTWASSRMENSVSAPQNPRAERAKQIRTKPPRRRSALSRKAALGVGARGLSPVRLAMMVGGSQARGRRRVRQQNTNFKGTSVTTSQRRVRELRTSGTRLQHFQRGSRLVFKSLKRRRRVPVGEGRRCFCFFLFDVGVASSIQLLKVERDPEIHHNGGESRRRGNAARSPSGAWISRSMDQSHMMRLLPLGKITTEEMDRAERHLKVQKTVKTCFSDEVDTL